MKARVVSAVGVALLCGACGEGERRAAGVSSDGGTGADAGNSTFETAQPIAVDSRGVFEKVDGREDIDFYSFEGRNGEWVEIRSGYFDRFTFSDTTLTLFGPDRSQLAYNRYVESLRGEKVLARIITRLPVDGTYYVEVGDPEGPPYAAGLSQSYLLTVTELTNTPDGYTVEPEEETDLTPVSFHEWTIDPVGTIGDSFVVGSFSDTGDIDGFSFTVAPGDVQTLSAEVQESGSLADGSTTTAGKVWITDESGSTIIARIDNSAGQTFLGPPLGAGNYMLWVGHPDAPVGANDFYVLRTLVGPENPTESSDAANGTLQTAEPLANTTASGQVAAFFLSHVLDDDVDYFRFDAAAGQLVSLYCESTEGGSGLIGLRVSFRDDADEILKETTESPVSVASTGSTISLEDVPVPASGRVYVRISKDGQMPDVTGDWARCAVYAR